jgi:DNA-binding CsgD family transcriptional regulator
MTDYSRVPWVKVHEYLLQVGSCRTIREFAVTACREAERLIPFDATACLHRLGDGRWFERCLGGINCTRPVTASFNTYYRLRQPGAGSGPLDRDMALLLSAPFVEWRRLQRLEYASDFMIANKMSKSLARILPAHVISLSIHRTRQSQDFREVDAIVLDLLNQHLNQYWSLLVQRGEDGAGRESARAEARRLGLTMRETEIALLLAERLAMPEIARKLFISPRTVEKHAENIYGKLGISSKREVGERLRGFGGEGSWVRP